MRRSRGPGRSAPVLLPSDHARELERQTDGYDDLRGRELRAKRQVSLTLELDVPAECDITCPSFASVLAVMGFPETTCEESNGGCRCLGTAQGTDLRTGEYAVDDTTLTLTLPYGDIAASYCAGENSFSYVLPTMLVPQGTPMDVVYETARQ